jgi:hypothetical protein
MAGTGSWLGDDRLAWPALRVATAASMSVYVRSEAGRVL